MAGSRNVRCVWFKERGRRVSHLMTALAMQQTGLKPATADDACFSERAALEGRRRRVNEHPAA